MKKLSYIDLFCGIGSFHYSFQKLGWECKMACDINEQARKTYEHNYSLQPLGDVTTIDPSTVQSFDILCAGFPCFIEGTVVLTNNGYKPIEKVMFHDKLLTHTGKFQSIVNIQQKIYNGKLYTFYLRHQLTPIICTDEHPFYIRTKIKNGFGDPEWKPAKHITPDDYFGMVINRKAVFPTTLTIGLNNKDMWFMMGYFVHNGWIEETCSNHVFNIMFSIPNKDEEELV